MSQVLTHGGPASRAPHTMSSYYDSRGREHSSQYSAESANRSYAEEDVKLQKATERNTKIAAGAAVVQALSTQQLLDVQRQQASKAEEYQEAMLRAKAAELEIQAARAKAEMDQLKFTRDIQWLERCDAHGRYDYLLTKNSERGTLL